MVPQLSQSLNLLYEEDIFGCVSNSIKGVFTNIIVLRAVIEIEHYIF